MSTLAAEDSTVIEDVTKHYRHGDRGALVPFLQDVQRETGYLSRASMRHAADFLEVPLAQVYAVATFYKAFHLTPRGKTTLKVCVGTTCHIRGATTIIDDIRRELGVGPGETTDDLAYSIETVGCVGACALAPVILSDDEYITSIQPGSTGKRLRKARKRK
jgi:NADH-quinone oxidoreductase subunit E